MAVLRYALPALAVVSSAVAQSSASCSASTTTIQNGGDASALASCTTFTGSIAIATGTAGNIALDGIQEITGSLIANNVTGLSEISGSSLQTIGDDFELNQLVELTSVNFPSLTQVGHIDFEALPNLQGLSFTDGIQEVTTLSVVNTKLTSLEGIELMSASSVTVTNNPLLTSVSLLLSNVTGNITIAANGPNLDVSLVNLVWVPNLQLNNISTLEIPALTVVNQSFNVYSDYFSTFSGPNLTMVGGHLAISSNGDLTNISLPQLTTVGQGLTVTGNNKVESISFPDLKTISGDVRFQGAFTNVSLPSLNQVVGAFNLTSTGDISAACSHFQSLAGTTSSTIEGKESCTSGNGNTTTAGSGSAGSGTLPSGTSSPSASSTHSGANNLLLPGMTTGLLGVVAALFGML